MKKLLLIGFFSLVLITGCQQVEKNVADIDNQAHEAADKVVETKENIEKTIEKVDKKVQQAKEASNAINKLLNE